MAESHLTLPLALVLIAALPAGCQRKPSPTTAPTSAASAPAATAPALAPGAAPGQPPRQAWQPSNDPKLARFVGYTAPKPATWLEHPPQSPGMRVVEYVVPGRDGHNAAEIVVFHFNPGDGGTIDTNIARWESQFKPAEDGTPAKAKLDRFQVEGINVTLAELQGEWKQMFQASYTPDQLFLSAIVETPAGTIVLRFAGDIATVQANRDDFMAMLKGLHREGAAP